MLLPDLMSGQVQILSELMLYVTLLTAPEQPAKLSPTVYTILQLVCRTRALGIATKDLGALTGYDPRSIHYQITQLLDLGLLCVTTLYM